MHDTIMTMQDHGASLIPRVPPGTISHTTGYSEQYSIHLSDGVSFNRGHVIVTMANGVAATAMAVARTWITAKRHVHLLQENIHAIVKRDPATREPCHTVIRVRC